MLKTTRMITYLAAFIAFSTNTSRSHAISAPEIAQILTAALIAPTTWAGDAAQAKKATPAVTNSLLILADINRLAHDALMYYNEGNDTNSSTLKDSARWVSCTASLNLYLLAEHILALKNDTVQAEPLSFNSTNTFTNKALTAGRITLPALESLCSLIIALDKDNRTRIIAKFGKNLAQHSNQLLHCNSKEQLKIISCIAALLADCSILGLSIEEVEEADRRQQAEADRIRGQAEADRIRRQAEADRLQEEVDRMRRQVGADRIRRQAEAGRLQEEVDRMRRQAEADHILRQAEADRIRRQAEADRIRRQAEADRIRRQQADEAEFFQRIFEDLLRQRQQAPRTNHPQEQRDSLPSEQNNQTVDLRKRLVAAKKAKANGTATQQQLQLLEEQANARNRPASN